MKKTIRVGLCLTVVVPMLCTTVVFNKILLTEAVAKSALQAQGRKVRETKTKSGREISDRVNQLSRANKQVRNALKAFERNSQKNGRSPKTEDSWAIVSNVSADALARALTPNGFIPNRKASFNSQQVSEDGIEIIFVPTYSVLGEWQGTVICNLYDPAGNFLDQYVADVVLVQELTNYTWIGVYEVSFEGGEAWLQSDPALGMIMNLNFQWGTPVEQQPPDGGPAGESGPISSTLTPKLLKVSTRLNGKSISPQGAWRPRYPTSGANPRMRAWVSCTAAWCAGAGGVGCGVLSLLSAGAGFGPCATATCLGSAASCGIAAIF